MMDRLEEIEGRYEELEKLLATPQIASDPNRLREVSQELASLREAVDAYRRWKQLGARIEENQELLGDPDAEISELARTEIEEHDAERARLVQQLRRLLIPRDPDDVKNAMLEIRAGAGGDEASLFAADLFRMYTRYAEAQRWKVQILALSESEAGGLKEVIADRSEADQRKLLADNAVRFYGLA